MRVLPSQPDPRARLLSVSCGPLPPRSAEKVTGPGWWQPNGPAWLAVEARSRARAHPASPAREVGAGGPALRYSDRHRPERNERVSCAAGASNDPQTPGQPPVCHGPRPTASSVTDHAPQKRTAKRLCGQSARWWSICRVSSVGCMRKPIGGGPRGVADIGLVSRWRPVRTQAREWVRRCLKNLEENRSLLQDRQQHCSSRRRRLAFFRVCMEDCPDQNGRLLWWLRMFAQQHANWEWFGDNTTARFCRRTPQVGRIPVALTRIQASVFHGDYQRCCNHVLGDPSDYSLPRIYVPDSESENGRHQVSPSSVLRRAT